MSDVGVVRTSIWVGWRDTLSKKRSRYGYTQTRRYVGSGDYLLGGVDGTFKACGYCYRWNVLHATSRRPLNVRSGLVSIIPLRMCDTCDTTTKVIVVPKSGRKFFGLMDDHHVSERFTKNVDPR